MRAVPGSVRAAFRATRTRARLRLLDPHSPGTAAYTDDALRTLLGECGFDPATVDFAPNLTEEAAPPTLQLVTARRG